MSDSVYCYIVEVKQESGDVVHVGPFDYKFQARDWLLNETGSATGGKPILVLKPQSAKVNT
jgi:hypothetical protein